MLSVSDHVMRLAALVAVTVATGLLAASARAQSPTVWGGGTIRAAGIGATAVTLQRPAADRLIGRVAFGITCGHVDYTDTIVGVHSTITADGLFHATGSTRLTRHGRATVEIYGGFSPPDSTPNGYLIIGSRGIHCAGSKRDLLLRPRSAPVGKPTMPLPQ